MFKLADLLETDEDKLHIRFETDEGEFIDLYIYKNGTWKVAEGKHPTN